MSLSLGLCQYLVHNFLTFYLSNVEPKIERWMVLGGKIPKPDAVFVLDLAARFPGWTAQTQVIELVLGIAETKQEPSEKTRNLRCSAAIGLSAATMQQKVLGIQASQ